MRRTLIRHVATILNILRKSKDVRIGRNSTSTSGISGSSIAPTTLLQNRTYLVEELRRGWRNQTNSNGTTPSLLLNVTARAKATERNSTIYFSNNGGQGNFLDTNSRLVAFTASVASLGGVVLILLVLIGFILYAK